MQIKNAVAVVTGAARGIGRSIARQLAERQASVAIIDRDGTPARAVADEIGGIALQADATDKGQMRAAMTEIQEHFGHVNIVFSNVGVWTESDVTSGLKIWERDWRVNFMSHVVAIQEALPTMLAQGGGHLAVTASAAGLLSSIGSATYATTKAAAVALAEWTAIEYGDRNIRVSCLCPLAVDTDMLNDSFSPESREAATRGIEVMSPAQVARIYLDGIETDRFLIIPHQDAHRYWKGKVADPDGWIRGMQRLRSRTHDRP